MKLLMLLLVVLVCLVCSVPAYAGNGIRGDANQDGEISMGDVTMLCRMILGYNPVIPEADINGDGEVNMGDVVFTERVILGLSKVVEK